RRLQLGLPFDGDYEAGRLPFSATRLPFTRSAILVMRPDRQPSLSLILGHGDTPQLAAIFGFEDRATHAARLSAVASSLRPIFGSRIARSGSAASMTRALPFCGSTAGFVPFTGNGRTEWSGQ